jgi:hypothetical protein
MQRRQTTYLYKVEEAKWNVKASYIDTLVVAMATTNVRSKTPVREFYLLGHNAVSAARCKSADVSEEWGQRITQARMR